MFRGRSSIVELMELPFKMFNTLYYNAYKASISKEGVEAAQAEQLEDTLEGVL